MSGAFEVPDIFFRFEIEWAFRALSYGGLKLACQEEPSVESPKNELISMITRLPEFIPAKPTAWLIKPAQIFARLKLAFGNRLVFTDDNLKTFERLPQTAGVILASNHADETDPIVCLELSRRIKRRFFSMCNREAFDELSGLAGFVLQRIGHFSVKRGAHDAAAKTYAIETVQRGNDVLMIFPEGEIFYLNELVQPFHSGAVEICMQAIIQKRKVVPTWTAMIVPMAVKYHYGKECGQEAEKRISLMESHLHLDPLKASLQERLFRIQSLMFEREKKLHSIQLGLNSQLDFTQKIILTEKAILSRITAKHADLKCSSQASAIDQAWQLEAQIRADLATTTENKLQLQNDLATLQEVAQLSSWRPSYYTANNSFDRLAEAILKQEREVYRVKRPRPQANRQVFVKFGTPIDMGAYAIRYERHPHSVRHEATEAIHAQIQSLIEQVTKEANLALNLKH